MSALARIIAWLNTRAALAHLPASASVPSDRPARFITVERTGGPLDVSHDMPNLAIQVWGGSVAQVDADSDVLRAELMRLIELDGVQEVRIGSTYNWPDPDSKQARYQTTVSLVTAWRPE